LILTGVQKLSREHEVEGFDCGKRDLNRFLSTHALSNQRNDSSQTFVVCEGKRVVAYYSLTVAQVQHEHSPAKISAGMPRYPIPVVLLAKLAVQRELQSQGIGKALLKDALNRTLEIAESAGVRALLVHAKDEDAKSWYLKYDFEPSPQDPLHLFLLTKDIRAATLP